MTTIKPSSSKTTTHQLQQALPASTCIHSTQELSTIAAYCLTPEPPSPPPTPKNSSSLLTGSRPACQVKKHQPATQHQEDNSAKEAQQVGLNEKEVKREEIEATATKPKAKCRRCGADNYAGLCPKCFEGMDFR